MSRGPCSSARVGVMGILLHPFFPVEDSRIPASPGLSQQLPEEDSRIPAQLLLEEMFSTLPSTDSGNFEDGLRSWKKGAGSIWEPPEEEFHEKSNQLQGIPSFSCWNEGEGDSPIVQREVPEAPAFPKKRDLSEEVAPGMLLGMALLGFPSHGKGSLGSGVVCRIGMSFPEEPSSPHIPQIPSGIHFPAPSGARSLRSIPVSLFIGKRLPDPADPRLLRFPPGFNIPFLPGFQPRLPW